MENLPKKIHTFTNQYSVFSEIWDPWKKIELIELEIEFRLLHLKGSLESVLSKQIKVLQMTDPNKGKM